MAVPDAVLLFAVGWAHARIYRAPRLAVDGEQGQIQLEDAGALAKRDPSISGRRARIWQIRRVRPDETGNVERHCHRRGPSSPRSNSSGSTSNAFIETYNETAKPFLWTKSKVSIKNASEACFANQNFEYKCN